MRNKRRIIVAILLVAVLAGLTWEALRPREPVYQGKPLSVWLDKYSKSFLNTEGEFPAPPSESAKALRVSAETAILQIGTNAIPTLIKMLRAKDSALKSWVLALIKEQSLIHFHPHSDDDYHWMAVFGFVALGQVAEPAVPELINLLSDQDSNIRMVAASSLGAIGSSAHGAVPALLRRLNDQNKAVRMSSATALGKIHSDATLVVPALIHELHQLPKSTIVHGEVVKSLGEFGVQAKAAVPDITTMLSDPILFNRKAATNALLRIDPEAAAKAGIK